MNLCPFCGKQSYENGCCIQEVRRQRDEARSRIAILETVAVAAIASVKNPAWAGICDEDVALEQALIAAKLI